MTWYTLMLVITILTTDVATLKILGIISSPFHSHYMAFRPLFREYAKRGHYVTVINNFPYEEPLQNLRFVYLNTTFTPVTKKLEQYENNYAEMQHVHNYVRHLSQFPLSLLAECDDLFTSVNAKAHLGEGIKYDIILVEQFMSDCGLAYAAILFDAPIIGITANVLLPWMYPRLGIPFDVVSDSFYYTDAGTNPSLLAKLEGAFINFLYCTIGIWRVQRNLYERLHRYLPNVSFDLEQVARERMKMVFAYQHYSVTGVRKLAPRLLEIGGMHVSTPKPLPKDIEEFLSRAKHGAVYVSFGTNLQASTMSPQKLEQFLAAFRNIPQKILWQWGSYRFPSGYDDKILARDWFPQVDVLCHPKVVAFVSHGGMLSVSESAQCGKPMLVMPFFGDQFTNAASVRESGLGKVLYYQHVTADTLAAAIKELTSSEMQQSAQRVSKLWHDRPRPAVDSAIYWTEYVARHRQAPPPLPAARHTWFENTLLDVYIVFTVIILCVIYRISVFFYLVE